MSGTESLVAELDANTTKYDAKINKSKDNTEGFSDEAENASKKTSLFGKAAAVTAGSIAVLATGIGAATAKAISFARATGEAQKELENQAYLTGKSAEEFKSLSFAMGSVGITAEKFSDQTKDASEKVGEFVAELEATGKGTGGLADFMTVMGYTEEQIKSTALAMQDMSGDQVLQFMVAEMEKAEAPLKQMSWAMEGVASDATALIPLFEDNAKVLNDLTSEFESLNNELSDEEKQNYKDFAKNMNLVESSFKDFMANALAPFLPQMNDATKAVAEFFAEWNAELDMDRIGESIKMGDTLGLFEDLDTDKEIKAFEEKLEAITEGQKGLIDKMNEQLAERGDTMFGTVGLGGMTQEKVDAKKEEHQALIDEQQAYYDQLLQAESLFQEHKAEITADAEENERVIEKRQEDLEAKRELDEQELEQYAELKELMREIDEEDAEARDKKRAESAKKEQKTKEDAAKLEAKLSKNQEQMAMRSAETLLSTSMSTQEKLFSVVKDAAAGQIEAYGLTAGAKALAELGPIAGPPVSASYIGWSQVAAGVVRALPLGGGGGGGAGTPSGGGTGVVEQRQADFEQETTDLELTESSVGGSNVQRIEFATDSGDELMDAIASALNNGQRKGQF